MQASSYGDPLPMLFKLSRFVKNMAARGRGSFSQYICIENFKILLVRNHWTDFNIIRQKWSYGVHAIMIRQKTLPPGSGGGGGGRGLFSLHIYIENFKKIFLSETAGLISI